MKDLKEIAEKWSKFKERQSRIYERNIHSDEYHQSKKMIDESIKVCANSNFNLSSLIPWSSLDIVLSKEKYEQSIEGMLNWINDGEPE